MFNVAKPIFLAIGFLALALGPFLAPNQQGGGTQSAIWSGQVVTTTIQSTVVPCVQGANDIGRKMLIAANEADGGVVTVTADLRENAGAANYTSGLFNIVELAAGSSAYSMTTPNDPGGRFCQITAQSASTSTITVTLRRE